MWWLLCVVKGWTLGEAGELVGQESHRKQGRFCWCGFFVCFVSFMNCSERFDPVTPLTKFMLTNQMWFRSGKTTGILCSFCYQASLRHPWQSTRTPLSICRCVTCFEKSRDGGKTFESLQSLLGNLTRMGLPMSVSASFASGCAINTSSCPPPEYFASHSSTPHQSWNTEVLVCMLMHENSMYVKLKAIKQI